MQSHLINSQSLSKNSKVDSSNSRHQSREKKHNFGPSLAKQKQLEISKKVRKMIHYDCNDDGKYGGMDDDIPDEDEIYIKENLLMNLKEKQTKDYHHITE